MTRIGTVLAGAWRAAMRDYLAGVFANYDAAEAARAVVASGPPLGVTWRHPGEMDEASKSYWRSVRQGREIGLPASLDFFERLKKAVEASNTPERIAAQNLQCRMAALYPTWSARTALFFE